MKIFALHGTSGTGKSHKASMVAAKFGAEAIIDDGLLIYSNKVIAGSSAKREPTKIASVRRALFSDNEHVRQVKNGIKEHKIGSVLIIGTSEEMCSRIAKRLDLGEIFERVSIQDVSTQEEIETANRMRTHQGKHVIPVPTLEIKKDFSGYFLHPLRIFKIRQGKREAVSDDKTVVRPTYSYMGDYFISDNVIEQMVIYEASKIDGVERVFGVMVDNQYDGAKITLSVALRYGVAFRDVCNKITDSVIKIVDKMTAINVSGVNINVKELKIENK